MPYYYRDFNSLLVFLQLLYNANIAYNCIASASPYFQQSNKGVLQDPYKLNAQNRLQQPRDKKYCFTALVFKKYIINKGVDTVIASLILVKLFYQFIIYYNYLFSYIVNYISTIYIISQSIYKVYYYNITLENNPYY